jgi:hypothetical protein
MTDCTTLRDCHLPAGDAFQDSHTLLLTVVGLDVNKVSARQAMLSYEDRLTVPLDVREEFRGLAL